MENLEYIVESFRSLKDKGVVHTQRDFANLLGVNEGNLSRALKGDERYLTDGLITKVKNAMDGKTFVPEQWVRDFPALDSTPAPERDTLLVIPTEAMAGTLCDFVGSVTSYECERMTSPIKGAEYAIKVCGDSMTPEYPSGCQVLIKKVNEKAFIEWGKVYVLDTENGAVVKRIRKTDREDVVECVSINSDYQPFTIETKYIRGWYRVLMVLSLK